MSWILQAIKRFGDYYYTNNREVVQLIRENIERYDLDRDLYMNEADILAGQPDITLFMN